jgi:hypothetical protein
MAREAAAGEPWKIIPDGRVVELADGLLVAELRDEPRVVEWPDELRAVEVQDGPVQEASARGHARSFRPAADF